MKYIKTLTDGFVLQTISKDVREKWKFKSRKGRNEGKLFPVVRQMNKLVLTPTDANMRKQQWDKKGCNDDNNMER